MRALLLDRRERPLRTLRVSVTDRCNLRCAYCMPEETYAWLRDVRVLRFEELATLARAFASLGVDHLRLTGGEPLVRRELPALVALLAAVPGIRQRSLTTNGVLLAPLARELRAAGLTRVTVSLDTLVPRTFERLTRRDLHARVIDGIVAASAVGFPEGLKLDTVVVRGVNDLELVPLLDFAAEVGAELRFIEYMDVGGATRWSPSAVVGRDEILAALAARLGPVEALPHLGSAPAARFRLGDGRTFGIVASVSRPFCARCDRARLTADGTLFTCLYATRGVDLAAPLRSGASPEALAALVRSTWEARDDRGAEERAALQEARGPLARPSELRASPHLEMHRRGG